jgi:hypothetical protein
VTGTTTDMDALPEKHVTSSATRGEQDELRYLSKIRLGFDLNEYTTSIVQYRH